MSYSKFKKLDVVREKLGLTIKPENSYFSKIEPQQISDFLKKTLDRNFKLAVSIQTEKARSELIVAPILVELKIISNPHISLFSGTELNVDPARGLNGVCD